MQILPSLQVATLGWITSIGFFGATAGAQERILPELPQASSPLKLVAASGLALLSSRLTTMFLTVSPGAKDRVPLLAA